MRKLIFASHVMARIKNAKTRPEPTGQVAEAVALLYKYYSSIPAFWRSALPILLMPKAIMRTLRTLYQKHSPSSGARRAAALRA